MRDLPGREHARVFRARGPVRSTSDGNATRTTAGAKKQLWEASNEFAWKEESEGDRGGLQTAFGLAANGDLVRLDQGRLYCGDAPVLRSSLWVGGLRRGARRIGRSRARVWMAWASLSCLLLLW
jgi:hypothetical protein